VGGAAFSSLSEALAPREGEFTDVKRRRDRPSKFRLLVGVTECSLWAEVKTYRRVAEKFSKCFEFWDR